MLSLNRLKLAAAVASLGVAVLTTVAHANPSYYRYKNVYGGGSIGQVKFNSNPGGGMVKLNSGIVRSTGSGVSSSIFIRSGSNGEVDYSVVKHGGGPGSSPTPALVLSFLRNGIKHSSNGSGSSSTGGNNNSGMVRRNDPPYNAGPLRLSSGVVSSGSPGKNSSYFIKTGGSGENILQVVNHGNGNPGPTPGGLLLAIRNGRR